LFNVPFVHFLDEMPLAYLPEATFLDGGCVSATRNSYILWLCTDIKSTRIGWKTRNIKAEKWTNHDNEICINS